MTRATKYLIKQTLHIAGCTIAVWKLMKQVDAMQKEYGVLV